METAAPSADRALGRIRTCDTRFRKPVLYPLSYEGLPGNGRRAAHPIRHRHNGHADVRHEAGFG
jgi:hypothetical protein